MTEIGNWNDADKYLGSKQDRPIANNTRLQRREDGAIAVKLHATDVVTFRPNGDVVLSTGGWQTVTTKERLNRYVAEYGVRIWSERGVWSLYALAGRKVDVHTGATWPDYRPIARFFDGITLRRPSAAELHGKVLNPEPESKIEKRDRQNALTKKQIRQFVAGFMAEFSRGMAGPGAGDCFFCGMREVSTGKPLGEVTENAEHLVSHLEESYYVPSLLWNSVAAAGYRYPEIILGLKPDGTIGGQGFSVADSAKRALVKYLTKRLVVA